MLNGAYIKNVLGLVLHLTVVEQGPFRFGKIEYCVVASESILLDMCVQSVNYLVKFIFYFKYIHHGKTIIVFFFSLVCPSLEI